MLLKIKLLYLYPLLAALLIPFSGCEQSQADPEPAPKVHFVAAKLLFSAPVSTLQPLLLEKGFGAYSSQLKYDVSVYKMVYSTTYQNKEILASGLVYVPEGISTPAPVLSAQHGTNFAHREAPSYATGITGLELLAASGAIILEPDYIGFGESEDIFHPYYDQKHSALAVVDMIKAAQYFCKERDVPLNNKLFLFGYSEGGYVTLAAQKEIETNPAHGLKVTASAAGAGGYDLTAMLGEITSGKTYATPAYLAYILKSYNDTYNWKRPFTDFYQEPYASRLPVLLDGKNTGSDINKELPSDPVRLFAPAFFEALQDDSRELSLKKALQDNSLTNWAPQSPTRLYHGTADVIVPYSNSEKTYAAFVANGAKNTTLITVPGGTHGTAFGPILADVIPWMLTFN